MLTNPIKTRMISGQPALGMIVRLARTPDIARIAKTSNHDFIFLDTQHALFDVECIGSIAQAAIACGVAPLVRARSLDDPDVPRLLDNGVMGIVFPDINNGDEARRAVEICKFAPTGKRSVSGGYAVYDFRPMPLAQSLANLNDTTLVVCMIETIEGLLNVEKIAAVPGVDIVHIGCNDLLTAMGKPGAFGDPEIMSAVRRVIEACNANGKWSGLGGDKDINRQAMFIQEGIRFITTQSDIAFLISEATHRTMELRQAAG